MVHDLMRVYENLTQSSTPQGGNINKTMEQVSTTLSLAYNNNDDNNGSGTKNEIPPQSTEPPATMMGYSIAPPALQNSMASSSQHSNQNQQTSSNNYSPSYDRNSKSYKEGAPSSNEDIFQQKQQQQGGSGYIPVQAKEPTQKSGEEPQSKAKQQPTADASSESDDKSGVGGSGTHSVVAGESGRSRKKRKDDGGCGGGKKKSGGRSKKSKKEDGRWSKRFTWPEDLHRDFVSAIFDVGLKHSSPSTIIEHMPKHEQITTERIKSHLQKYRLHRVKSKKEFISSYEASLRNFQQQNNNNSSNKTIVSGSAEVAAHLTSASLASYSPRNKKDGSNNNVNKSSYYHKEENSSFAGGKEDPSIVATVTRSSDANGNNESLMLPQLTEAEKASPIGSAMGYLMGLFFSLKQQLMIQRSLEADRQKAKGSTLFSSTCNDDNNNTSAVVEFTTADGSTAMQCNGGASGGVASKGRTDIEENSMMKREMQNQMALQNKMRALKQQELDKYKNLSKGAVLPARTATILDDHNSNDNMNHLSSNTNPVNDGDFTAGANTGEQQHQQVSHNATAQGTGEMAGNDLSAGNLLSIENTDDFWQSDVVDEQLFEFLMNN